jgi:NAD(P)-dependent dehydrogenase (short-subunit alcohol dehydrogenase family)
VAVVTGAASGIGYAMAERFAAEGMRVVLADVEDDALARAEEALRGMGATVVAVPTDVADAAAVEALAAATLRAFGAVHVVCNNAGVGVVGGTLWEQSLADWQWVMGVNLWGVIHGVRTFVPILLAQDSEGHIVNTASSAGLVPGPGGVGGYPVAKFGVVALSEVLALELAVRTPKVKVSVLCPNLVNTRLMDADRNRPAALRSAPTEAEPPGAAQFRQALRERMAAGLAPARVADAVVAAIQAERFYVLPHPEVKEWARARMKDIVAERYPHPRPVATPPPAVATAT